jgi:hypothetical protein
MRTYTVQPNKVGEYEKRFGEAYEVRQNYSKMGGMWHTEIGPLNQIIHIWPYADMQERADIRAKASKDPSGKWPPQTGELLTAQQVDILDPVANMKPWGEPQRWGEVYELRVYTYAPGDMAKAVAAFNEALPGRDGIYPVAGMFAAAQGNLNRLYQLFPYKSFAHREEVRAEFRKAGVWPPHAEVRPTNQEVRYLYPAAFSPIH